jgi:hypothetical protein
METIKSINNEFLKMAKKEIASCEDIVDKKIALKQVEKILFRNGKSCIEDYIYEKKLELIIKNPELAKLKGTIDVIKQVDAIDKSNYSIEDLGMLTENFLINEGNKPLMYIWAKKAEALLFSSGSKHLFLFFDTWEKLKKNNYLINLDEYDIRRWMEDHLFVFSKSEIIISQLSSLVEKYNYNLLYKMFLGMQFYNSGQCEKAIPFLRNFIDSRQKSSNEKAYFSEKYFEKACIYLVLAYHKLDRQDMAFKTLELLDTFEKVILSMGLHLNTKQEEKAKEDFDRNKVEIMQKFLQLPVLFYNSLFPDLISFIFRNLNNEYSTNSLYLPSTSRSPQIVIGNNIDGKIYILGRVVLENTYYFFAPIFNLIDFYVENLYHSLMLNISIEYGHGTGMNAIFRLLQKIVKYYKTKNDKLVINWFYEMGDEDDMGSYGEDIKSILIDKEIKNKENEGLFEFNLIPIPVSFEMHKRIIK